MNAALSIDAPKGELGTAVNRFLDEQIHSMVEAAHTAVRYHRKHFLMAEATAEQRREFDRMMPWLIRMTRLVHGQMLDPEFPHTHLAEMTSAALWQLQQAWEGEHPAQPVEESDKILAHLFPDEPRA